MLEAGGLDITTCFIRELYCYLAFNAHIGSVCSVCIIGFTVLKLDEIDLCDPEIVP